MHVQAIVEEITNLLQKVNSGATRVEVEKDGTTIKAYKVGDVIRIDIKQKTT